jgi:hypothetical protein
MAIDERCTGLRKTPRRMTQCASPHRPAWGSLSSLAESEWMMTNPSARLRQSGSFIAGLLIGVSIVTTAFAWTDIDSKAWQACLVLAAPVILVLGLALRRMVVASPRVGSPNRIVCAAVQTTNKVPSKLVSGFDAPAQCAP